MNSEKRNQVANAVAAFSNWRHRIDVGAGVITPGHQNSELLLARLEEAGFPQDCSGLRALDIGCNDGEASFRMEKRGAEVTAIDREPADATGFAIAHELLQSNVVYQQRNVYDLTPERDGPYDLVMFLGVIYHLRNPFLALDRIRTVMPEGGVLMVVSAVLPGGSDQETPLMQLNIDGVPFPDHLRGTVWVPNLKCLVKMLERAQFTVYHAKQYADRAVLGARATSDAHNDAFQRYDYAKSPSMTAS